jgi:hypothetical protein
MVGMQDFAYNQEHQDKGNLQSLYCDQDRVLKDRKSIGIADKALMIILSKIM